MKKLALSILAFALVTPIILASGIVLGLFFVANDIIEVYQEPACNYKILDSNKLFDLVNQYRVSENLAPLIKDEKLCVFANHRVIEIQKDYVHDGFLLIRKFDHFGFKGVSENLMTGGGDEVGTLDAWKSSPPHNDAMLDDYQYTCVSCLNQRCVQIFAR